MTSGGCLTSSFLSMDTMGTILNAYMYCKNNVLTTRNWPGILSFDSHSKSVANRIVSASRSSKHDAVQALVSLCICKGQITGISLSPLGVSAVDTSPSVPVKIHVEL